MDTEYDITPGAVIARVQQHRMECLLTDKTPDTNTIALLRDMAKTAMDETRIETDDNNSKSTSELAAALAKLVNGTNGNPLATGGGNISIGHLSADRLPDIILVNDEISIEQSTLTYADLYDDS